MRAMEGAGMATDSDWRGGHDFDSPIAAISFRATTARTPIMGDRRIPALVVVLDNDVRLKVARHIATSDWDPCFYTIVEHDGLTTTRSEWTEFNDAYGESPVTWSEQTARTGSIEDLVGKKVTHITEATWCTIVEFSEDLFIEVTNNDAYGDTTEYRLNLGAWTDKAQGQAERLCALQA